MARRAWCLLLATALIGSGARLSAQPPATDPELAKGVKQVEDGDYDAAILTLDNAARRLAADPKKARDLSQAYLYLGIAYFGKGHEAAAKAKFREAIGQIKDLSLSPDKYPPKVINLFEAAKEEAAKAPASRAAPAPSEKKKGGSGKTILIVAGLAAAGGGVALAAKGGGGGDSGPTDPRKLEEFSGSLADQEERGFVIVATTSGTLEGTVTWTDPAAVLGLSLQESDPPYTNLGRSNRTTNTTSQISAQVVQKSYLLTVSNFSGRSVPTFMLSVKHP